MSAEAHTLPRAARKSAMGAAGHLRQALLALAGGHGEILRLSEKAWASVTFEGARHTVEIAFAGDEAAEAGERFIADLPEHEFAIPGQLVADAAVIAVDHTLTPCPRLAVTCELLLLKDT
jgi:hypothetical protein